MPRLSGQERLLLDALVNDDTDDWWKVIPDTELRNLALTKLIDLGLCELKRDAAGKPSGCRATPRGIESNNLARARKLVRRF